MLVSCTTLEDPALVNAPYWYPDGRNVRDAVCFVGYGSGINESASRDAAYNDILSQVSSYLGYDVVGRYYREFSANGSISDLSLEIDNTSSVVSSDGNYHYYILAFADEDVISSRISEEYRRILDAEAQVQNLKDSALEYYRQNNDIAAINTLLEAVTVAARYDLSSEGNTKEELLAWAYDYLDNIELRLSKEKPEVPSVTVRAVRNRGLLSPSITGASVNAGFTVHTHDNTFETFTLPFVTGNDGRFQFVEYYPAMTDKGTVVFTIDIQRSIDEVVAVTGYEFMKDFIETAQSIRAEFEYDKTGRLSGDCLLVVASNNLDQDADAFLPVVRAQFQINVSARFGADVHHLHEQVQYLLWGERCLQILVLGMLEPDTGSSGHALGHAAEQAADKVHVARATVVSRAGLSQKIHGIRQKSSLENLGLYCRNGVEHAVLFGNIFLNADKIACQARRFPDKGEDVAQIMDCG